VSVNYGTADDAAVGGQDYEAASGQLHWADGETGERTIVVPVLADSGAGEEYEYFNVSLSQPQGGAGLGARDATVTIAPDGAPAGQFSIEADTDTFEGTMAQFWLYRNFYTEGTVCVTLTPESGSAIEGDDFEAATTQYCWGDQDAEAKLVGIPIVNDTEREDAETFSVQLSDPTGGAVIGPRGTATFSIQASDQVQQGQGGDYGGGGAAGFLSLLLLGLAEALRAARRWIRKPQ
jgi:Calx-beta domain-containing protein